MNWTPCRTLSALVLAAAALAVAPAYAETETYKCTRKDGGIFYTDTLQPGCTKIATEPAKKQSRTPPTPKVEIVGFSEMSCGTWMSSAGAESSRAQYFAWFRGFFSGYNYASKEGQIAYQDFPDQASLALYVDKFCRENPLKIFPAAMFDLVKELPRKPVRRD